MLHTHSNTVVFITYRGILMSLFLTPVCFIDRYERVITESDDRFIIKT